MSTIKSSDEHLTLNADGSSKDIKLQSNASEKVIVKSDGKVGIGTSSPSAVLETKNTTDGTTFAFQATNDNDHEIVQIGAQSDGDGYLTVHGQGAATNIKALIHSDGDSYFNGGNVGIGHTSTTGSKLAICDGANSQIQFFPEISTDTNLTQHYDPTAAAYINAETRAASHSFKIGTTSAMTIDNSGWVGIGVAPNSPFHVKHNSQVDGVLTFDNNTGESNTRTNISILRNGTSVGSIRTTTSSTAYNTSSDYRLKENVDYDWDATTRLKQLKPARFNFIKDDTTTVDGFLAHEVSDIVPEAIGGEKDAMMDEEYEVTPAVKDEDGNIVTEAVMGTRSVIDAQSIDQSKLVPLLVKTIQELEARITALEA